MGKVASTSIHHTLEEIGLDCPIYHIHYVSKQGIKSAKKWFRKHTGKVPYSVKYFQIMGQKFRSCLNKVNWRIISLVREPISKEISNYFEIADKVDHGLRNDEGNLDIKKIEEYFFDRFNQFDINENKYFTTSWFDQELKGMFNVDVYQYPFDHKKGYSIIKRDNIKLLVMRYENINEIFSEAVRKFLNLNKNIKLKEMNIGASKWYSSVYEKLKNDISFPEEVCRKVYNVRYVKHFYTDQEIERMVKKWTTK